MTADELACVRARLARNRRHVLIARTSLLVVIASDFFNEPRAIRGNVARRKQRVDRFKRDLGRIALLAARTLD